MEYKYYIILNKEKYEIDKERYDKAFLKYRDHKGIELEKVAQD